ncbi:MAG: hypothetical protein ACLQNE_20325 [Thermoguttaceae bacterium]
MATRARPISARREQADAIRDGAVTRGILGQAATHRRLSDGRHEVSIFDRGAGELRVFSGETIDEAIILAIDGTQGEKEPGRRPAA